jgi:hypothetical protein
MKRYRYAEWDGMQAFADIDADDVLDEAVDDLLQHGDLTWALRRLSPRMSRMQGQKARVTGGTESKPRPPLKRCRRVHAMLRYT